MSNRALIEELENEIADFRKMVETAKLTDAETDVCDCLADTARRAAAALEAQEWRDVPGWEGIYQAHPIGVVRRIGGGILGTWPKNTGYQWIRLTHIKTGKREMEFLHRVIAKTFHPNPDNLPCVNHLDHDPGNNRADNLEWCTQKHNLAHARNAGRMANYWINKRSANARLSDDEVRMVHRFHSEGMRQVDIARDLGVHRKTIYNIIKGDTYPLPEPPNAEKAPPA